VSKTFSGTIIIIGYVNVKVHTYSWNEIESVHFYVDRIDQYNLTKPPIEWNINKRYITSFLSNHTLTVYGFYKDDYYWNESINETYLHLLYN